MAQNFKELYDEMDEYKALRNPESKERKEYELVVDHYKVKYLANLCREIDTTSILEIGCAVGILLDRFPSSASGKSKIGVDLSDKNIATARDMFPELTFFQGSAEDYLNSGGQKVDLVILSDILEHVEDDAGLLRTAGQIGKHVVVNLPLEKCGEFKDREYGVDDYRGHLRAYDLYDAQNMVNRAGMKELTFTEERYVQEPAFRKYLADKLFTHKEGLERANGLAKYTEELIDIDLNPEYYKTNYFALLTSL